MVDIGDAASVFSILGSLGVSRTVLRETGLLSGDGDGFFGVSGSTVGAFDDASAT